LLCAAALAVLLVPSYWFFVGHGLAIGFAALLMLSVGFAVLLVKRVVTFD
jgi:hypothetical protein